MMTKKILLLGGSDAQLISIKKAKELGYYTVLCDFLSDNPGQYIADSFHLVSTTDKDAVLAVAKEEGVEGVVAYSSDPAAPTAAYVANAMGLHGMDYDIVRHFCEKHLFREFLIKNNFNVPQSIEIKVPYDIKSIDCSHLQFPLIVKPTDSSGSKGITVIENPSGFAEALEYAQKYSRNKTLIIEEFIVRDHPYVIEAEIFAINGKVVSWGIINSIRDPKSNPLLPSAYSYPLDITDERKSIVKNEVSRLVATTGKTSGAFNIEMIIDKHNRLFFLDAGPRNGGNMLPEFISMISGKDIVEATLRVAMGDIDNIDVDLDGESGGYWGLGVLHSDKAGKFNGITYSPLAKQSLIRENIQKEIGQNVNVFERCNDLVGLNFCHFKSKEDMDKIMCNMYQSMKVELL
ncbi:MAG: ATP-grasp domain-containing protein [Bacteroidales bacterium]|nr:ATP-grasp domain-containing protein [Bacteroidales bacterium]